MSKTAITVVTVLSLVSLAGAFSSGPQINVDKLFAAYADDDAWNPIFVTGGADVQGLEFNIEIGGGTEGPLLAIMPGILFSDSALVGHETIFASNNEGIFPGSYCEDRSAYAGTVTAGGTVATDGMLAMMRFDATGITWCASYSVSLINTPEEETNFAGVPAEITDGVLIVTCRGDTNGDCFVDIQDLTAMAINWSAFPGNDGPKYWKDANFNPGDGGVNTAKDWVVDLQDLVWLATNWTGSSPGGEVPEPTALGLLAVGGLPLLRRRKD